MKGSKQFSTRANDPGIFLQVSNTMATPQFQELPWMRNMQAEIAQEVLDEIYLGQYSFLLSWLQFHS